MYVNWLFGVPQNPNFSFQQDTDNDGLADNWTGDSAKCEIYEDAFCRHGQKIYYTNLTSDLFSTIGGVTRVSFRYMILAGTHFSITLTSNAGVIMPTVTKYAVDTGYNTWQYHEEEFTNSIFTDSAWFLLHSSQAHIVIEDLAVVHDNNQQEFVVNPTNFEDTEGIREDKVHTINDENFLVKPILYYYQQRDISAIFDYVDRDQLDYLKSNMRTDILIRMSDDRMMPAKITNIEELYRPGELGECQTYSVRVALEEI